MCQSPWGHGAKPCSRDVKGALCSPLSRACTWESLLVWAAFPTLLPRGCGEQDSHAVCFESEDITHCQKSLCQPWGPMELRLTVTNAAKCCLPSSQQTGISTALFLLPIACGCIWQSCLEEHQCAVVAGPWPLPSLLAGWASGCNFAFLFFRTKVHVPCAFMSSTEL